MNDLTLQILLLKITSFSLWGYLDMMDIQSAFGQSMLNHAAEMLVISPFVDKNILNQMVSCNPSAKKTLITRHASVTQEVINLFNDGVYAPKEVLTDKVEKDVAVDLHEKVYFIRRNEDNLSYNHLYLGSTNATMNGFRRNVEFLLHLKFAPYKSSYEKYRSELINDSKECMFEQFFRYQRKTLRKRMSLTIDAASCNFGHSAGTNYI